eukprot:765762-Hanusia_phi.AAC.9
MNVALVACLNIRVDPPDVIKPSPCARMECWVDPQMMSPHKALETIGKKLEAQYRRWQPRANYQQGLDPKVEDVKKLCDNLRKEAKDERVLFHYNGHGVPRPTANSEIWVFNKNFTQYIPLSVYDLQTWLGSPSVFVFDCSNAGVLVNQQHRDADLIILAACSAGELLPQVPEHPHPCIFPCLLLSFPPVLLLTLSPTAESGATCGRVHVLPDHAHHDGAAVVLYEIVLPVEDRPESHRSDPGAAQQQKGCPPPDWLSPPDVPVFRPY